MTCSEHGEALLAFWKQVETVVAILKARGGAQAFDDATLFLRAFGHGIVAWLWLDQAIRAKSLPSAAVSVGIDHSCRFFFETELPQARAWLSIVEKQSDLTRAIAEGVFA